MEPHHASATAWPPLEHVVHARDALDVDVGKQQQVDASFSTAIQSFLPVAVEGGLVQVRVGVDQKHGAAKIGSLPAAELLSGLNQVHAVERGTGEVAAALKARNYDYLLDLHGTVRSRSLARALDVLTLSVDRLGTVGP